jgi:hypothetical protein
MGGVLIWLFFGGRTALTGGLLLSRDTRFERLIPTLSLIVC